MQSCKSRRKSQRALGLSFSLALVCPLFLAVIGSEAAPILDQMVETTPTLESGFALDIDKAQTFTVGLAGYLTRVDVKLHTSRAPTENVFFDIRTTTGGVPTELDAGANILFSTVIPKDTVPVLSLFNNVPWTTVNLGASSFLVASGDVLTISLRTNEPIIVGPFPLTNYWAAGSNAGVYPSGANYYRITDLASPGYQPSWKSTSPDHDLFFRTYVDADFPPVPVPVPATVFLFGSALVGLAGFRKKFKK